VLFQRVDEVVSALRGKDHADKRIAVVRAVNHERPHLLIADPIVQTFELGVAKAELSHPLRQALAEDVVVLQLGKVVGIHIVEDVVASELVSLEESADGAGTVDVDASGAAGDATLVPEAVISAGVEVDETKGDAFSM
jgi:hypothetical protein